MRIEGAKRRKSVWDRYERRIDWKEEWIGGSRGGFY